MIFVLVISHAGQWSVAADHCLTSATIYLFGNIYFNYLTARVTDTCAWIQIDDPSILDHNFDHSRPCAYVVLYIQTSLYSHLNNTVTLKLRTA